MPDHLEEGLSRRRFLQGTAAGLTGLGVLAVAPSWVPGASSEVEAAAAQPDEPVATSSTPLVAYVRDAAKGEVVLMAGTREFVRRDPGLVSRLIRHCET